VALLLLGAAVLAPTTGLHAPGRRLPAEPPARPRPDRRLWGLRAGIVVAAAACLVAIGVPLAETNALRQSQAAASAHHDASALAAAQSALRIEPGAASAELQAALVLEQQHRIADALLDARAATADEPANWQNWLVRSRLEAEAGHPRLAVAAFRRARTLNPQSSIFQS
jgi:tetratricopeptide (TPR) repeat protein